MLLDHVSRRFRQVLRYSEGICGLKDDDIILASFPKSGNTWVRFFLCNLISIAEWGGRTVDFHAVDETMPELGVDNLLRPWNHTVIPRFVKTHRKCWNLFRGRRSVVVIRDPRDVMVSFYHFETAKLKPRFAGTFSEFIRHDKFGLPAWFSHFDSWIGNCSVVLTYEGLRKDDAAEFSRMFESVGVSVRPELTTQAARLARFDKVREVEQKFGLSRKGVFDANYNFSRQGKAGTWRDRFSEADVAFYRAFCNGREETIEKYGYGKE